MEAKKKTGRPSENLRLVAKMKHAVLIWFSSIISIAMKYGYTRRSFVKSICYAHFVPCAEGRSSVQAYQERLAVVLNQRPGLRAFMVTLTIKDGEDLKERFNKLRSGLKKYQQQRRDAQRPTLC